MRSIGWILTVIFLLFVGVVSYFWLTTKERDVDPIQQVPTTMAPTSVIIAEKQIPPQQKTMPLTISSPAFEMNGIIPAIFTCDGKNISPKLIFSNIPSGTQSLALTMEDPDVPKNIRVDGMWNHWVVWNIPTETTQFEEGKTPPGVLGAGTNKKVSYIGPCPPDREHRYIFTLYALDALISLQQGSTKEELLQALAPHIVEKAVLLGTYNRN